MKKVNLTEITEAMESLGYTASYSAGKVTYKAYGDVLEIKDTDTLADVLYEMYELGKDINCERYIYNQNLKK